MSFNVNGITWTPESANAHAQAILASINAVLTAAGQPTLSPTISNAVWLMALAAGQGNADYDTALAQAVQSLNLSTASEQQILNLLPIAGTTLIPASYSSVVVNVVATSSGSLTISAGALLPFNYNGVSVNFVTQASVTVAASGNADIAAICDTAGAINVGIGQLTAFSTSYTNLSSVTNPGAAAPGRSVETPNQARQRLINGDTVPFGLGAAIRNLKSIPNVIDAQVLFNGSATAAMTIPGGGSVPARNAYICVYGSPPAGDIATAYATAMIAPTVGSVTENYVMSNGQVFPVKYDLATTQVVYIQVFYDVSVPVENGYDTAIKATVTAGIPETIGPTITAEQISNLFIGFTYASIIGASVSLDGVTWHNKIQLFANAVPSVLEPNVVITGE